MQPTAAGVYDGRAAAADAGRQTHYLKTEADMLEPGKDRPSIDGRWHLVPAICADDEIPTHRVDLIFHDEPDGLRGALLSRVDDREVPLRSLMFDGVELRLRMSATPIPRSAESPYLVMRATSDHFEGAWEGPGIEHIRLKLVRARPQE